MRSLPRFLLALPLALSLSACPEQAKTRGPSGEVKTEAPPAKSAAKKSWLLKSKKGPEAVQPVGEGMQLLAQARDPVCKRAVSLEAPKATHKWGNELYTFCSEHCQKTFIESPKQYTRRPSKSKSGPK